MTTSKLLKMQDDKDQKAMIPSRIREFPASEMLRKNRMARPALPERLPDKSSPILAQLGEFARS
jgi:hypothetical protein